MSQPPLFPENNVPGSQPPPPPPYGQEPYGQQPYGPQPYSQQSAPYGQPQPPYDQQQPYYPPPPQSNKTNGMAIASLVFGIVGGVLLSAIFGFVALSQIRRRGDRGRGMAVAGLVLSAVWLVIIASLVAVAISNRATRNDAGQVTKDGKLTVLDLKAGDCFNNIPADDKQVESVDAVPCAQPHDAEVLVNVQVPGTTYPGKDESAKQVEKLCVDKIGDRLANSKMADRLDLYYLHPSAESWKQGDHAGTCIAAANDGKKLTAPVG